MGNRHTLPVALVALGFALLTLLSARSAEAHPWMIRHRYTACAQCHADPSGSGTLTQYGQAQGELIMATRWAKADAEDEPGPGGQFLLGLWEPPSALLLGASLRVAGMHVQSQGQRTTSFLFMQGDLRGQLRFDRVRLGGSIGVVEQVNHRAAVTQLDPWNMVSREYWVGVDIGDESQVLLRAGRMQLPYGLRGNEHTMWIRQGPRTDINQGQQHGVAIGYFADGWRAELMGIAGNYQLSPDDFRERGYSLYVERALDEKVAVGISSLMTYAKSDIVRRVPLFRQAHGAFARWAPVTPLVLMAQGDVLVATPDGAATQVGADGALIADVEPVRGLHFNIAGELLLRPQEGASTSAGGWLSCIWYFLPKLDARVDYGMRNLDLGVSRINVQQVLWQLHGYL